MKITTHLEVSARLISTVGALVASVSAVVL